MSRKVIVNIISDQTVQNLQFIKEFQEIGHFIFITTTKMEEKGCSDWIIKASGIDSLNVLRLKVNEFDIDEIKLALSKNTNDVDEYFVNITGGTKLMSIAVKDFFEDNANSKIYYLTGIKSKYFQLYPKEHTLKHQVTLFEYLNSYGIDLKDKNADIHSLIKSPEKTEKLYQFFCSTTSKPFLKELRDYAQSSKKQNLAIENIESLADFLKDIGFDFTTENQITKEEASYLTGKWLEEYTYSKIKMSLNLTDEFIGLGLVIQKDKVEETDNDFDVMFMWQNDLYIIECKTSHFIPEKIVDKDGNEKTKNKSKLTDYIYKLDAIRKDFGIFPKAFIYTLSNLPEPKNEKDKNKQQQLKQIQDRLRFHNITLLTYQEKLIDNQQNFDVWLENLKNK